MMILPNKDNIRHHDLCSCLRSDSAAALAGFQPSPLSLIEKDSLLLGVTFTIG